MTGTHRNDAPIGVFDSGLGGLTVMKEIMHSLPEENIIYFGDTARVPYGSKSRETIIHYVEQILHFMEERDVKAIVVACGTASAYALEAVRHKVSVPIIGVVRPGVRAAASVTKNGHVGVIGTEASVKSGLYESLLHNINPALSVTSTACPLFVPLAEEGLWEDEITTLVAKRYLLPMKEQGVDTLIMGCTHYPLLEHTIRQVMGPDVKLVNIGVETAAVLRRILGEQALSKKTTDAPPVYRFYSSDAPEKLRLFGASALKMEIPEAVKISIEDY